jgi:hypothetical protein
MKTAFAVNGFTDLQPVLALSPVVARERETLVCEGSYNGKN